jgi:hypothetical protein
MGNSRDDPDAFQDLPRVLATIEIAGASPWSAIGSVPPVRHSTQPDEPQYLYDLRDGFQPGHEGA